MYIHVDPVKILITDVPLKVLVTVNPCTVPLRFFSLGVGRKCFRATWKIFTIKFLLNLIKRLIFSILPPQIRQYSFFFKIILKKKVANKLHVKLFVSTKLSSHPFRKKSQGHCARVYGDTLI